MGSLSISRSNKTVIRTPKRDAGRGKVSDDPYILKNPPLDRSICRKCHAVYQKKRWALDDNLYEEILKKNGSSSHIWTDCPGCQKIADHFPMGIIHLQGDYWPLHKEEILNLVKNEEERARGYNPLERISSIRDLGERLEIETTNEKLAQRIGKSLRKAHQGVVHYKWSNPHKFIRVEWERSLPQKRSS